MTEAEAIEWLVAQLPDPEEAFIAQLRAQAEREGLEAELAGYTIGEAGPVRIEE